MDSPTTFDEGLPKYVQAIRMAYQEEGDIAKAREKVADLRAYILTLPTQCGISKWFRVEQAETQVAEKQTVIQATVAAGDSHD